MDEPAVFHALVEVGAGRSVDLGRPETLGDAGAAAERIPFAEAEEADQRVIELVPAASGRRGELRRNVERHFAERRIIAVDQSFFDHADSSADPLRTFEDRLHPVA